LDEGTPAPARPHRGEPHSGGEGWTSPGCGYPHSGTVRKRCPPACTPVAGAALALYALPRHRLGAVRAATWSALFAGFVAFAALG
jgi:hypothetical protein